jgi:transcription antitermination factor NusB
MNQRRASREIALQAVYMHELGRIPLEELLQFAWLEDDPTKETAEFARTLIEGTLADLTGIDSLLQKHCRHWKLERLAAVDRSILRVAVCEMRLCADIPAAVTINEAIELGKAFGGENSGQFINGVLDSIQSELKR